ncbi:MAG: hypothetical protein RIM96_01830, partial [Thalassobaculum sp.]|uniref:hypothetical protein n=1 Tax=Thalassobaculum sp. TaxID=2022740 RepID=UPI0032EBFB9B
MKGGGVNFEVQRSVAWSDHRRQVFISVTVHLSAGHWGRVPKVSATGHAPVRWNGSGAMGKSYSHLSYGERLSIMDGLRDGLSV